MCRIFALIAGFGLLATANAQELLDTVTVDGYYVVIPGSMATNVFGGHLTHSPTQAPCGGGDCEYTTDMTKAQVCRMG